jgi:ABC-type transporter Mla subunit MlaD
VNVVVTEEQHALLSKLAKLDPSVRSASAFLRAMLDRATPLLRKTVPLMEAAAEELNTNRGELRGLLDELVREVEQFDQAESAPGDARTERSEGGRAKRRARGH